MRQSTRLTKKFSKKVDNVTHAMSLRHLHDNVACPHQTLTKRFATPTTPAMATGKADRVWSVRQNAERLDLAPFWA